MKMSSKYQIYRFMHLTVYDCLVRKQQWIWSVFGLNYMWLSSLWHTDRTEVNDETKFVDAVISSDELLYLFGETILCCLSS